MATPFQRQQIVGPGRSAALLLLLFLISGCTAKGPRDEFRSQLAEDVEELLEMLEDYRPGTVEVDQTVYMDGRSATKKVKVPRSVIIGGRVRSLGKYFDGVSLALLLEDMSSYDAWSVSLKEDVEKYRAQLLRVTDELTRRVQANPAEYTEPFKDDFYGGLNDLSVYSPAYGFGLESLIIAEDGEVYFVPYGGDVGYSPKGLFDFDLDAWLAEVKAQSLSMQPE